jgi:UDPglucose 6-dehydrogenase
MNIGIVGLGVVGTACRNGFESIGHTVSCHDIKLNTTIEDVLNTELVYICVPTRTLDNGDCDISILTDIVQNLADRKYTGIVAIKSTVPPGTTQSLMDSTKLRICFVPEFLREWCADDDFKLNHTLLAVGCNDNTVFDIVKDSHGNLPMQVEQLTSTEAEILKYYSNAFNSLRIVFANTMFELCDSFDADYDKIKETFLLRKTASPDYMNCSGEMRGFGGVCLPKDIKALIKIFNNCGLNYDLIKSIESDNNKFKKTIRKGMRE